LYRLTALAEYARAVIVLRDKGARALTDACKARLSFLLEFGSHALRLASGALQHSPDLARPAPPAFRLLSRHRGAALCRISARVRSLGVNGRETRGQ
jgi:hypothetical protein